MTHEHLLWIAVAFYGAHILEEFNYDWQSWVKNTFDLTVDWSAFYVTNTAVIILGVCCAAVGWRQPQFSLIYASLMVINALFSHLLPTIVTRRFSPGLITALLFFLPLAGWIYVGAYQDGVLSTRTAVLSTLGGAATMVFPVALIRTRDVAFFKPGEKKG